MTPDLLQSILIAASARVNCTKCGVEELVSPLDDQPLDDAFLADYLCEKCEES